MIDWILYTFAIILLIIFLYENQQVTFSNPTIDDGTFPPKNKNTNLFVDYTTGDLYRNKLYWTKLFNFNSLFPNKEPRPVFYNNIKNIKKLIEFYKNNLKPLPKSTKLLADVNWNSLFNELGFFNCS